MKAILLSSAMTAVLFFVATVALRYFRSAQRVRQLTLCYLACLLALAFVWEHTPDELGFLSADLVAEPRWVDFAAMVFYFSAAFFGGILQLYNLADRGFSLRILVDFMEAPEPADPAQVAARYSRGRGLGWMYRKRIDGLLAGGFISISAEDVALTPKGAATAAFFARARRFFGLPMA
jgi:hypothetical protein